MLCAGTMALMNFDTAHSNDSRFTLQLGEWYAAELIGDEFPPSMPRAAGPTARPGSSANSALKAAATAETESSA